MAGYIVGMIIGSILMILIISYFIYIWLQKSKQTRKIRMIGRVAEEKINEDIKIWTKQTKNLFIKAGVFSYGKNKVFEIDSLIITSKALYVVEIKSIKGIIKGDAHTKFFQKQLGDQVFNITNPVIQNDIHIHHITKMLNQKMPIVSLIIYSNRADYLNVSNVPDHVALIKHSQLFDTLDQIEDKLPIKISQHDMQVIFKEIKSFRATKKKDLSLHKKITRGGK